MELFAFGEMPEEIKAMIDQKHMAEVVTRNTVDRFMDELPIEDLVTLRVIIRHVAMDPSNYNFFDGVIYSRLRRENRCTTCGGPDHDHEALEAMTEQPAPSDLEQALAPAADTINGFTVEDLQNMEKYDLDDLRDEETNQLLGFICTRCGMRYPSLEDRMMRAPDECDGCFQKAKHG